MTAPPHPVYCEHGLIVGWYRMGDPDRIVSRRMAATCSRCDSDE